MTDKGRKEITWNLTPTCDVIAMSCAVPVQVLLVPGLHVETQFVTTQTTNPTRSTRGIYLTLFQQRGVWFSPVRSHLTADGRLRFQQS